MDLVRSGRGRIAELYRNLYAGREDTYKNPTQNNSAPPVIRTEHLSNVNLKLYS
jgi:hypothetical protein